MTQEHKMIFEMLKNGTISTEEAEKLMDAVPAGDEPDNAKKNGRHTLEPKRLVIKVIEHSRQKVSLRVPFPVVRAALRLGQSFSIIAKRFVGEDDAAVIDTIKNVDLDEILQSVSDGTLALPATIVDVYVEDDGVNVLIILE